jgi:hypothetical protein
MKNVAFWNVTPGVARALRHHIIKDRNRRKIFQKIGKENVITNVEVIQSLLVNLS